MARDRGFTQLLRDRRKAQGSLLVTAGSFILGGLLSKDKFVAANAGMSGFEGFLQGLGTARWFVSIGKKVLVAPQDTLSSEVTWFTWESLMSAIEELKVRASRGEHLGNCDNIIDSIKGIVGSNHPLQITRPDQLETHKP